MEPRAATPMGGRAERVVYADADGKSQITAAAILGPSSFKNAKYLRSITHIRAGGRWEKTFVSAIYIYGLKCSPL